MKNGLVIAINRNGPVVLEKNGMYTQLKKIDHIQIGEKIYFDETDRYVSYGQKYWMQAIAAVLIISLVLISSIYSFNTTKPYLAIVTIDINPSIELHLDQQQHINTVVFLNADAKKIFKKSELLGFSVEEGLEIILQKAYFNHYLDGNGDVLISTAIKDTVTDTVYKTNLEKTVQQIQKPEDSNVEVYWVEATVSQYAASVKAGLSMGKYVIYAESEQSVTIEEFASQKVGEILAPRKNALAASEKKVETQTLVMPTEEPKVEQEVIIQDQPVTLVEQSLLPEQEEKVVMDVNEHPEEEKSVKPVKEEKPVKPVTEDKSPVVKEQSVPVVEKTDPMEKIVMEENLSQPPAEEKIVIGDTMKLEKIVMDDLKQEDKEDDKEESDQ